MTVEQMRAELIRRYRGKKWRDRVLAMHENQVVATYQRIIERERAAMERVKGVGRR